MQLHCKKCGKDVSMETEIQNSAPYRIINNHMCEAKAKKLRDKIAWEFKLASALERGFVL